MISEKIKREEAKERKEKRLNETNIEIVRKLGEMGIQPRYVRSYIPQKEDQPKSFFSHKLDIDKLLEYYQKENNPLMLASVKRYFTLRDLIRKIYFTKEMTYDIVYKGWSNEVDVSWLSDQNDTKQDADWVKKNLDILKNNGYEELVNRVRIKSVFFENESVDTLKNEIIIIFEENMNLVKEVERNIQMKITTIINETHQEYKKKHRKKPEKKIKP